MRHTAKCVFGASDTLTLYAVLWYTAQVEIAAVRKLETAIYDRVREVVVCDGMVVSADDWKWKYHGRYLPVLHKLPGERGFGWPADNLVIMGTHITVLSRKRVYQIRGANTVLESNGRGLMACATILANGRTDHGYVLVFDRGYCTRRVCESRTSSHRLWGSLWCHR